MIASLVAKTAIELRVEKFNRYGLEIEAHSKILLLAQSLVNRVSYTSMNSMDMSS